jgi:hypothetical protein
MRFQWGDKVWANKPMFFHGHVVGYLMPILMPSLRPGALTWICMSNGGTTLFVKDEDLHQHKETQMLHVEGKNR